MTNEVDEMSAASRGSQEPAAWLVERDGERYIQSAQPGDTVADGVVPLYRKPMLTDAERTCLGYAIRKMDAEYAAGPAGVLRELLERLS